MISVPTMRVVIVRVLTISFEMISVLTTWRGEGDAPSKRARALTKTDGPHKIFFLACITLEACSAPCTLRALTAETASAACCNLPCSATSPSAPES